MSARPVASEAIAEVPLLHVNERMGDAARRVAESGLPALPVVDRRERLAGLFGEQEMLRAIFEGSPRRVDEPVGRWMNGDYFDAPEDHSDAQVVAAFLRHRVQVLPVVDADRHVVGVITRTAFFRELVAQLLEEAEPEPQA